MTTVRDLITDALEDIGVLAAGQALDPLDGASCLRVLNRMVASWADDELLIFTKDRLTFTLVNGQQSYTIGVGGNFVTTYPVRPSQIDLVSVLMNNVEIPIDILNDEQWRDISLKNTSSTIPLQMWANGNYPLDVLYFWPIPTQANSLIMTVWSQIPAFADLNTVVTLPKGYEEAIVPNLSVRCAPKFGREASQTTMALAGRSLGRLKAINWEATYRTADSALKGTHNNIGQRSRGYVLE